MGQDQGQIASQPWFRSSFLGARSQGHIGPLPWWVYSILAVLTVGLVASGGPEVSFMFRKTPRGHKERGWE